MGSNSNTIKLKLEEPKAKPGDSSLAVKLLKRLIQEKSSDMLVPVLMPDCLLGYAYPELENYLSLAGKEALDFLHSLAEENMLEKQLYSTFLSCPHCCSSKLAHMTGCPLCQSDEISHGRILEHFACGNVSLEETYRVDCMYRCPKCGREVRYLGTEYRSIGVKYTCHNCHAIFDRPVALCQCKSCAKFFLQEKAVQNTAYAFILTDEKKIRLQFDFGLKQKLVQYLQQRGYTVTVNAGVSSASKSGEQHVFDVLAYRYDGFLEYNLCIDIAFNSSDKEIGLEEIFKYDNKTYDLGIHDKVLIVQPRLGAKANKFAQNQRIKVYTPAELERVISSGGERLVAVKGNPPASFKNYGELMDYLKSTGYQIQEKVSVKGRSGISHIIDVFASMDDGLMTHTIGIGIVSGCEIDLDQVLLFEVKAFDIGVHDKVLITAGSIGPEAMKYLQHLCIKVIEFAK